MLKTTKSDLETINLGIAIGKLFVNDSGVILLEGDLASGKTTLTKGIAKGLGINEVIKSPTFTIMRSYQENNQRLFHLDLYRLNQVGLDFDLEEYILDYDSLVVIEWPNQVKELLPSEYLLIEIVGLENNRTLKFSAFGAKYEEVLKRL